MVNRFGSFRGKSKMLAFVAVLLCVPLVPAASNANEQAMDFVIVIHASNPYNSMPKAQIDAMFLGKVTEWPHGSEVHPVNNRAETIRKQFSKLILSRSQAAVDAYWAAKVFGDFIAPQGKLNDQGVVAFVAANAGAIGYVQQGFGLSGVKELEIIDL